MRKSETLIIDKDGEPVTLTFQRPTLKQEEAYRKKLKKEIALEAKDMLADFGHNEKIAVLTELAARATIGGCSLTGTYGAPHALQGNGMREFLRLAAYDTHPDIDENTLYLLTSDYYGECVKIVQSLLPMEVKQDHLTPKKEEDDFSPKVRDASGSLSSLSNSSTRN